MHGPIDHIASHLSREVAQGCLWLCRSKPPTANNTTNKKDTIHFARGVSAGSKRMSSAFWPVSPILCTVRLTISPLIYQGKWHKVAFGFAAVSPQRRITPPIKRIQSILPGGFQPVQKGCPAPFGRLV